MGRTAAVWLVPDMVHRATSPSRRCSRHTCRHASLAYHKPSLTTIHAHPPQNSQFSLILFAKHQAPPLLVAYNLSWHTDHQFQHHSSILDSGQSTLDLAPLTPGTSTINPRQCTPNPQP
eukprot:603770-Rhodomonas_salina.3